MSRALLLVCLGTGFVTLLDQSMVAVAVPALQADLGASTAQVQWVLAVYSLTFGLVLVPAGRLGDVLGRRSLHLAGVAAFGAAAVVSATATDAGAVVLARALQGVGAGVVNPQVHATLQSAPAGPLRARAVAGYGVVTACSSACGPLLGGLLVSAGGPALGWRLVLAVAAPASAVLLALAVRHLPRTPRRALPRGSLDLAGTLGVALLALVVLLPFLTGRPSPARAAAAALAAGAVLTGLLLVERRAHRSGRAALLDPALVRHPEYLLGTGTALCVFGAVLSSGVLHVLLLQDGLGLPAWRAGLVLLPAAVLSGVSALLSARAVGRWGRRTVVVATAAAAVAVAAELVLVPLLPGAAVLVVAVTSAATGAALGAALSPNQVLTLRHAPPHLTGVAAGLFQLCQRLSAAVAVPLVTGAYLRATGGGADGPAHLAAFASAGAGCLALLVLAGACAVAAARVDARRPVPTGGFDR